MLELWDGKTPTPRQIVDADPDAIRAAGMSRPKVAYLRDLAEHVLSGELELDRLGERSDEEIVAELTAVKGLGVWTAHMFLTFHPD
jgi:DNA-3-methyladenine glycosylase II